MHRSLRKRERRIHKSSYHKYVFLKAWMAYNKSIYSQKANFYEKNLNAYSSNWHNIFKMVYRILGSNLIAYQIDFPNNICALILCLVYIIITKCIKSKLDLIPQSMIAHQITEPTICKLFSFISFHF